MAVAAAGAECVELLQDPQSIRTLSPSVRRALQDTLTRFTIWAGNVGVFAPGTASLDYRLRDEGDLAAIILSMLTRLLQKVQLVINPPLLEEPEEGEEDDVPDKGGAGPTESPEGSDQASEGSDGSSFGMSLDSDAKESDDAGGGSLAEIQLKEANEILNLLYRTATTIRKPASSKENSKVRDFVAKLRARNEVEELNDADDYARTHFRARFPQASNVLVERLVAAVVFRRMRLLYRQRHQQKLRQGSGPELNPLLRQRDPRPDTLWAKWPSTESELGRRSIQDSSGNSPRHKEFRPVTAPSKVMSGTNASSVNKPRLAKYAASLALSRITQSAVDRRHHLDVPAPPSKGQSSFQQSECPYCFRMVKKEEMEEPRWTRHILKDLDPYVCLFESCGERDVLFKSVEEWLSHMQWKHTTVWTCQAPGHQHHTYDTAFEMEQHIRKEHPNAFTETQLSDIVNQAHCPAPDTFAILSLSNRLTSPEKVLEGLDPHECPICLSFQILQQSAAASQEPRNIQEHILEHLESIALLSLPAEGNGPQDLTGSNLRQSSQDAEIHGKDDFDLPAAVFNYPSGCKPEFEPEDLQMESNPENIHLIWDAVFLKVKQSNLPEPMNDELLVAWNSQQIAAVSPIAVIELAAKVGALCLEYSLAVKNAKQDIERFRQQTEALRTTAEGAQRLLQGSNGGRLETLQNLRDALANIHSQLDPIYTKLEKKLNTGLRGREMRRIGLRALTWPFETKDVDKIITNLQRDQHTIFTALQIDQTVQILDINRKADQILEVNREIDLPVAKDAAFDAEANEHDPSCHPATRVDLLADIHRWIEDPNGKGIFWLRGIAGTGKSTISRTVAKLLADAKVPSASFFFKKGEGDRGRAAMFFTTILAQLLIQLPALGPYIQNAIQSDPAIVGKIKKEQFEKLFVEPLNKCKGDIPGPLAIVIDALDECDQEEDVINLVHLLSRAKEAISIRIRFFVTSRPELPIRLGFKEIDGSYQDLALHEIPEPDIKKDILAFLHTELARIRDGFNMTCSGLPIDWPPSASLESLVDMAVPLFIFASTTCRFIADSDYGDPREQLDKILEYKKGRWSQLHTTYLPILNQLLFKRTENEKTAIIAWFRKIVGTIVLLADPLPTSSLERLLSTQESIGSRLRRLHSVLNISNNPLAPVKLFHLSFRDFLVDDENRDANPFWVDKQDTHKRLADRCLQLLSTGNNLKRDICGLRLPGTLRSQIEKQTINSALPPEVQYACRYWVHHWEESKRQIQDGDSASHFLTDHLLYWLEALSLMGRIGESVGMINSLPNMLNPGNSIKVSALLRDLQRFLSKNCTTIDASPLQIYALALEFAPEKSVIRKLWYHKFPHCISLLSPVDLDGNPCVATLEGHSSPVWSVAFSPDGQKLASASDDKTVKLWDAATGACEATLEGHSDCVRSVAFSPDGQKLASASYDQTVKLWDAATGACEATFEGLTFTLSFHATGSYLHTDFGDISLRKPPATGEKAPQPYLQHKNASIEGIGISVDKAWITWNGQNLLWLPAEYRPWSSAASRFTIAIGCSSGRVLFFQVLGDIPC